MPRFWMVANRAAHGTPVVALDRTGLPWEGIEMLTLSVPIGSEGMGIYAINRNIAGRHINWPLQCRIREIGHSMRLGFSTGY